jgi:hypothetical protein
VLGISLPLVALESLLRTLGPVLPGNYLGYLYLEPHPTYGYFHVPGSSGWLKTSEYMSHVIIGSHGLRERELTLEKPPGVRRVLIVGDSFIEGAQVSDAELLTRQLERRLSEHTGVRHEVINAGVAAWGTDQEYLFLKTEGVRYRPDLVIGAFYTGNDVTNNSARIKRPDGPPRKPYFELSRDGQLRPRSFVPGAPRVEGTTDGLRRVSMTFGFLSAPLLADSLGEDQASTERQLVLHELPVYAQNTNSTWSDAWQVTEALLLAMRDESERAGAAFMLVNLPTKWELYSEDWARLRERHRLSDSGWDLDGPSRRLAAFADQQGLWHLDLRPAFRAAPGPRLYFNNDIHWTPEGHATAARAIAENLLTRG